MNQEQPIPSHPDSVADSEPDASFVELSERGPRQDKVQPMTERSAIARLNEIRQEIKQIEDKLADLEQEEKMLKKKFPKIAHTILPRGT